MAFVMKLTFQSGDKTVLDRAIDNPKQFVEWKGTKCRGPHSDRPKQVSVPQYRTLQPGDQFSSQVYPVYARRLEIYGADQIVREAGLREFPGGVRLEVEVEQKRPLGHRH